MANEIEEKLDEEDKGYYSYILKNKRQQYGLAIVLIVTYVIFAFVIAQNLVIKKDWGGAMLPLFMFGLPLILCFFR